MKNGSRIAIVAPARKIRESEIMQAVRWIKEKMDRLYKKYVTRTKKYMAHDENNDAHVGDTVRIVECRPLSKNKCWRLAEIIERAK